MRALTSSVSLPCLGNAIVLCAARSYHQQAKPHAAFPKRNAALRAEGRNSETTNDKRRVEPYSSGVSSSNDSGANNSRADHRQNRNDLHQGNRHDEGHSQHGRRQDPLPNNPSAEGVADLQRLPKAVPNMGWSYDNVNTNGKTDMDLLYDKEYEKITAILSTVVEEVVNPKMNDGTTAPDFAIGLQYYKFGMRSTYKSIIAKQLGLHHTQVQLSTAWSSRYDPKQFPKGVQMVLGVTVVEKLDGADAAGKQPRRLLQPPQSFRELTFPDGSKPVLEEGSLEAQMLRSSIDTLVKEASALVLPQLVALQIVKATTSVSEVEFAKDSDASAAVWRKFEVPQQLFTDVRVQLQELVKVFSAVIIHSDSPFKPTVQQATDGSTEKEALAARLDKDRDLVMPIGAGEPVSFLKAVLPKWEKMFAKTELVPLIFNTWELEQVLKDCDMPIPQSVSELAAKAKPSSKGAPRTEEAHDAARTLSAAVAAATYDTVSRMATVARVDEMGTMSLSATTTHRFGTPRVLPACFIHGVFVGGIAEMTYLASNSSAFRAMAANPHDIRMTSNKLQTEILTNRKVVQKELEGMAHDPTME